MKQVVETKKPLNIEESKLLYIAYKNVIGSRRNIFHNIIEI